MNTQTRTPELLSNDYLLPLLGHGRAHYGFPGNFISCQLTDENQLAVRVRDRGQVAWQCLADHKAYFMDFLDPEDDTTLILYHARVWLPDLTKFRAGQYSQFSAEAKKRIREHAGNYDMYGKFVYYRDMEKTGHMKLELAALEKHIRAKAYWEGVLGVVLSPEAELVSLPHPDCFLTL